MNFENKKVIITLKAIVDDPDHMITSVDANELCKRIVVYLDCSDEVLSHAAGFLLEEYLCEASPEVQQKIIPKLVGFML